MNIIKTPQKHGPKNDFPADKNNKWALNSLNNDKINWVRNMIYLLIIVA